MKRKDMTPVEIDATAMWTLSPDRRSIRLTLPRLPLAHMAQPLTRWLFGKHLIKAGLPE
jgi:hypothetical protein